MATFRILKSGYTQAIVRRKGHPPESHSFRTKTEAEVWARKVESEIDTGQYVSMVRAERTTFEDVAKRFSEEFAPNHYRDQEWPRFLKHLVKRLGKYNLIALTPTVIAKYRDDRQRDPDPRYKNQEEAPRVSGSTVKKELELLSKVLDVASKEFAIPLPAGNPVRLIRKPKQGAARVRRLSDSEWEAMIGECKASRNSWLHPALLFSVETGMRQGELLGLEWKMIDKARRIAMLPMTKNGEARPVPLSSAALAILESLPTSIKGRVFPSRKMALYRAFKNACDRAEVQDFTWHDLRHEALSRLAERGDISILEMAAISGHKTLLMLKRYTHLQAEKLAEKLG